MRKAEFRSKDHELQYFAKCHTVIEKWREDGPKPLNTDALDENGKPLKKKTSNDSDAQYNSGLWLFTDRENIDHFFPPNFLPPYDTPEKRKIIAHFLSEEWDEKRLHWKPAGKVGSVDDIIDDVLKKIGLGNLAVS